jgi:hypothetical protein
MGPDRVVHALCRILEIWSGEIVKVSQANANDQPTAAESPHQTIVP